MVCYEITPAFYLDSSVCEGDPSIFLKRFHIYRLFTLDQISQRVCKLVAFPSDLVSFHHVTMLSLLIGQMCLGGSRKHKCREKVLWTTGDNEE